MAITNYEFKAKTTELSQLEKRLQALNPHFAGEDHQIDTYFNIQQGRLKLREGKIENALIWYNRPDKMEAKQSDVLLYQHKPAPELKQILTKTLGIKVIVDKIRRIYFIENVKFHFDRLAGLGTFIEVEAIYNPSVLSDLPDTIPANQTNKHIETLKAQCIHYAGFFKIRPEDYISLSYSDLLLQ
jgi:adenylate cyclase, class 2